MLLTDFHKSENDNPFEDIDMDEHLNSVEVIIKQEVTQVDIDSLLCTCFEFPALPWFYISVGKEMCKKYDVQYVHEIPTRGGSVVIFDAETDKVLGEVSSENIQIGLKLMSQGKNGKGKECPYLVDHLRDILNETGDANTADIFLQMVVMKEIVFG